MGRSLVSVDARTMKTQNRLCDVQDKQDMPTTIAKCIKPIATKICCFLSLSDVLKRSSILKLEPLRILFAADKIFRFSFSMI